MSKIKRLIETINWFAIASVIFLAIMVILSWPPGEAPPIPYDWIFTLATASIVSAIFAVKDDFISRK